MANAANSTLDISFIQHEPGALCTPWMDLTFSENLLLCHRYYAKSNGYATLSPTANDWRGIGFSPGSFVRSSIRWPVTMANNSPSVQIFGADGTPNQVFTDLAGAIAISSISMIDAAGLGTIILASAPASVTGVLGQWNADIGW